ncbi:MAG: lysylphosphatidylglycerol synthase transmembrane domain-containing protein [Bacteroidales bacterium]
MKKRFFDALKIALFLSIGVFFIWLFLHKLSPEEKHEIYTSFLSANFWWILLSVVLGILSHISRAVRWKLLLMPLGYIPGIRNTFFAVMTGYITNLAVPRLGEISRCSVMAKYEKIPFQKSFGTVVTERGIDLMSLILAFVLNFFIQFSKWGVFQETILYQKTIGNYNQIENPGLWYWSVFIFVVCFAYICYRQRHRIAHTRFYIRIREIVLGFFEGLKTLAQIREPFWFIFHTVFIWVMYFLMTYIVFFSLLETSHLGLDAGFAVLVFGSIGIIVVQGGIGIYPFIVAEILTLFAIPVTTGYAMGWLLWSGQTVTIILVGILSLTLLPMLNRNRHELS